MQISQTAERIAAYIKSLNDFKWVKPEEPYEHIGATLADAALQAQNNYNQTVRPRIDRIRKEYAEHSTLDELEKLLETIPAPTFLNWNGGPKLDVFLTLIKLLKQQRINTEAEFRAWLEKLDSRDKLLELKGVGPKTADYLKFLVGLSTFAIDSQLLRFINRAGIQVNGYDDAHSLMLCAAELLAVDPKLLDHSIWRYMTSGSGSRKGEIVICAAVRASDGRIIRGHRHSDAIRTLQTFNSSENEQPRGEDQGFVTSTKRFVNRREAYRLHFPDRIEPDELHSDDLY